MKRRNLLKLIVGVSLVAVLAIALPLAGGCTSKPSVTPTEPTEPTTPTEPTEPTEPTAPEPAQEQPTFNWRFQSYANAALTDIIFTPFIENLVEASGGRMQVETYLGDELVPIPEECIAVQEGTLDIVCISDDWGGFPADVAVFSDYFPFGVQTGIELDTLFKQRGLDEIWREAYDEVPGVTWLNTSSWDPCNILSNKPVESYEDLNGLRLHTFALAAKLLAPAGVIGQTLPWEDVNMAIETGMLDGICWCGITEASTVGWRDVCDHFLTQPISGGWLGSWFVHTESWEALPPDLQQLWLQAIDQMNYHRLVWYYWGEAWYRAHGTWTLTEMPDEDWAKVMALKEPIYDEVAAISPRCAEVIRIIREHQADSTAAGTPYPPYE
jgi:TRAP-type mannitol/chloroaromatic compound transport system substrate-binding protein